MRTAKKAPAASPKECAKRCSCGACFSREDLIRRPSITPVGMLHLLGEDVATTMYLFTHTRWSCRTTFALPVLTFRDEIHEEIPTNLLAGTDSCGGHCTKIDDLEVCENECALAPYRRFLLERLIPRK